MRTQLRIVAAVAGLLIVICPAWGQVKDTAELFPAHTLAYLEVRHPDQLSRELAELLKGSYLDDLPAALAKFRDLPGHDARFFKLDDELALFAFPEVLAEFRRFQGGAVALTGFTKENEPEIVGVLLPGDSNIPTLVLRVYLAFEEDIRIVEEVEGVKIYREKHEGADGGLFGQFTGPAFAVAQGAVIIGSTSDSVKDVIQRIKGKTSEPALTSKTAFKEAAKVRERPGLFGYADVAGLASRLDEVLKDKDADYAPQWSMIKTILNPKACRYATASLSLHNGNVDCQAQLILEPGQTSPLLELLPDKKANPELLHALPKDTLLALSASVTGGEKRWATFLKLADELAKAEDDAVEILPSKAVADAEAKLKCNIGKDVMATITGAALVFHAPSKPEKGQEPLPMLVISTDNILTAKLLERTLPKFFSLPNNGEVPVPEKKHIQGHTISNSPRPRFAGAVQPELWLPG